VNATSYRTRLRRLAAYVIAVAIMGLPALWNHFPLMFDDVGGYLERWPTGSLGLGRSTAYGLLLWVTRWGAFVPVILLQALVTTFVVDRMIRIFASGGPALVKPGLPAKSESANFDSSPWPLPWVIALLALASGVAFFVSKVIPDAWAAPAVLAEHLLAWHGEDLGKRERATMAGIVAFAGASHLATFGVLAGLTVLNAIAWLARRRLRVAPTGTVFASAAVWSGLLLLLCVNVIVAGRFTLTPGGGVFLLGRMVEDGMASEILREECPHADWQLCAFQKALPDYSEAFIFDNDSPLQRIGGEDDPRVRSEITSIITHSLMRHPIEHLERAFVLTARQFVDVGTGDAMEPLMAQHTRWILTRYAPQLVPGFDAAHQQTEAIDLSPWSDSVVVPISIVASFSLPVLGVLLWRSGRRLGAMLPAMIFMALVGNAIICGVMIGSDDRYQARLAWIATLTVGLWVQAWARGKHSSRIGAGVIEEPGLPS
jgi:hypothetical protein